MNILRKQPHQDHRSSALTPRDKAAFWAGLGLCFGILGVMQWLTPPVPPFSGKWSWLYGALHEAFGPRGIPLATFSVGGLFLSAAISTWWKTRQAHD